MTQVSVVELDDGGCEVVVEVGRLAVAFDLDVDEAVELGRALLDGGTLEGTHNGAGADAAQEMQGALGRAERDPQRLSGPLSDLAAVLHQQTDPSGPT